MHLKVRHLLRMSRESATSVPAYEVLMPLRTRGRL